MDRYRDMKTLKNALVDIDTVIGHFEDSVADEKAAQTVYGNLARSLTNLGRIESSFTRMSQEVSGIFRDESRHEGLFNKMLQDAKGIRQRVEQEIKVLKEKEEREKQQVKEPHGRYGKRY